MTIVNHKFTITYEARIDTDTGEILDTKIVSKSPLKESSKESSKVEDPEPKIILEENKYSLNTAAINLIGVSAGDKLDIKYEEVKDGVIPVIGTDEAFGTKSGCKLTKSHTVACRNSKNEELAKYGSEFKLVPHPSREGLFVLTSDKVRIDQLVGDNNVKKEDNEEELPFDIDDSAEEIDPKYFQF